ncbi:MAG: BMP family ABC transporter substrate-binding protein [Verrucomicrobia bacterium]|nr:BMP family ABC transporter substrate-binding protein [Verrucomicrobiota bacterium]
MNLTRLAQSLSKGLVRAAAALALGFAAARAADFTPAIIYDMGGKFDRSFNQSAYEGAEKFKKDTGLAYREFEITNAAQREQAMVQLARRGAQIILSTGFTQASAVEKAAKQFPNLKFVIIDAVVDLPNVQSINFREQESSFLCGMAAAMISKTGKVGFVGGMDIPLIRKFALGYAEGAKYVNPKAEVFQNMTGTTPAAWNDPTKGAELAKSQFGRGADVVFHAAGATGLGVMQAAKDAGKLSIGCDSNQNYLHPGSVLTSAVKRVDVAVYEAFTAAKNGTWKPGQLMLGLKENGVDFSLDEHNRKLITPGMEAKLKQAKADIISGKLKVSEYRAQ